MVLVVIIAAIASMALFLTKAYYPPWMSLLVFGMAAYIVYSRWRKGCIGPLVVILGITYALPFIHLASYLGFDFNSPNSGPVWGGLAPNNYQYDPEIVSVMGHLGAVGALGFATGTLISGKTMLQSTTLGMNMQARRRTLSTPVYVIWIMSGLLTAWVSAPSETIASASYASQAALSSRIGFSSAWLFAGVILLFCLADALFDTNGSQRRAKLKLLVTAVTVVVVFFGLMRGNRELLVLPAVAGVMVVGWSPRFGVTHGIRIRLWLVLVLLFLVQAVNLVTGIVRSGLASYSSEYGVVRGMRIQLEAAQVELSTLANGTWSAVLLTPLSIAGTYVREGFPFRLGRTYVDYLLSLPPGFVANAIGYERPLSGSRGPAWEMIYGNGGTHAVVVPFMNFGIIGVFGVIGLWAFLVAKIEKRAIRLRSVPSLSLLGAIALSAPHWLWYSDKVLITVLITWFVSRGLYLIGVAKAGGQRTPPQTRSGIPERIPRSVHPPWGPRRF